MQFDGQFKLKLTLVSMLDVDDAAASFLARVVHVSAHAALEEAAATVAAQDAVVLSTRERSERHTTHDDQL